MQRAVFVAMPLAATVLMLLIPQTMAQDKLTATRRGERYFVAAAKTYNMHANDHARMLGKYAAATEEPVPKAVIKEHATAMRNNVEQARKSYAKLAVAVKKHPDLSQQLAAVQERLAKVTAQIAKLEAASAGEAAESKLVLSQASAISQELKATHMAGKEIDHALADSIQSSDEFDDRQSGSYYSTGEGHFID